MKREIMSNNNIPLVSVVIPLKGWDEADLLRLLGSFAFQKRSRDIELIFAYCEKSPVELAGKYVNYFAEIKYVKTECLGVYNGFNTAIPEAGGEWVMFFGADDFVLPGLDKILDDFSSGNVDVIVCPVIFGNYRIFRPFRFKQGLVFRNWCQQGVMYRRKIFNELKFEEKYKIQSDHKFNIEVAAGKSYNIMYSDIILAYFSMEGISQNIYDWEFRRDMPGIVRENFGVFWSFITILRRFCGTILRIIKGIK